MSTSCEPKQPGSAARSVPDGVVVYAVGDVHGRADLLERLLAQIRDDARELSAPQRRLVFLGDYVDRGRESARVIAILRNGLPAGFDAVYLKGNHEAILLDFLADATTLPLWLVNGGDATLASYRVDVARLIAQGAPPETWRARFLAALPAGDRQFFEELRLHYACGDYLFVHAGLRPGVPLDRQSEHDCLWIRDEFLQSEADFGKLVVHGHTPGDAPVVRANRIGIDTMAWASGRLTALRLVGSQRKFLATGPDRHGPRATR